MDFIYCSSCGQRLNDLARFCENCGVNLEEQEVERVPVQNYNETNDNGFDAILRLYTQNDRYFEKLRKKSKWNWCVFLTGPIWMGYRKMYTECLMYAGGFILIFILELVMGESIGLRGAYTGLNIGMTIGANQLYYRKAKRTIDNILLQHGEHEVRRNLIIKKGGTTGWGILFGILAMIISVIIQVAIESSLS